VGSEKGCNVEPNIGKKIHVLRDKFIIAPRAVLVVYFLILIRRHTDLLSTTELERDDVLVYYILIQP